MSGPELARIRVLVVDDHPIVRRGIAFGLSVFEAIEVIGEAASGEEALKLYEVLRPDLVLMDINLPRTPAPAPGGAAAGVDGIAATQRLRAHHPEVRVLMLTHYAEPATIRAALGAGASGYLVKDVTLDELARAIQMAYAGHTILSGSTVQALVGVSAKGPEFAGVLTQREQQVLALVAAGRTNDEIAQELIISRSTVGTHMNAIMTKLDAANRAAAAAIGQRCKLFPEPGADANQARRYGAGTGAVSAAQWPKPSAPAPAQAALTPA